MEYNSTDIKFLKGVNQRWFTYMLFIKRMKPFLKRDEQGTTDYCLKDGALISCVSILHYRFLKVRIFKTKKSG